jgi:hypothetical protein
VVGVRLDAQPQANFSEPNPGIEHSESYIMVITIFMRLVRMF